MQRRTAKLFYTHSEWDEPAWLDVISVEYQRLIEGYPFGAEIAELAGNRLLDVGCGTAIFPRALDPLLDDRVNLHSDLLDISRLSLQRAAAALDQLRHFTPGRLIETAIEQIPERLPTGPFEYDLIWAIHSFTTVELARMSAVYRHLLQLLAPGGLFYVFQLTEQSSYQRLHRFYLERHPEGSPYMTSEDSVRILDDLQTDFRVHPVDFVHEIPVDQPRLVENYLRKCVLDESLQALEFFAPLLAEYRRGPRYLFPQSVNLISITRSAAA